MSGYIQEDTGVGGDFESKLAELDRRSKRQPVKSSKAHRQTAGQGKPSPARRAVPNIKFRPESAPVSRIATADKKAKRRPISAVAPRSRLKKEQKRKTPTLSNMFLKQYSERTRRKDREFQHAVEAERLSVERLCIDKVGEANEWSEAIGLSRRYRAQGGVGIVLKGFTTRGLAAQQQQQNTGSKELRVQFLEGDKVVRSVSMPMFLREHERLEKAVEKHGLEKLKECAVGGELRMYTFPVAAPAPKIFRPNKAAVQKELKRLLGDTVALTDTLKRQVKELNNRGWNMG